MKRLMVARDAAASVTPTVYLSVEQVSAEISGETVLFMGPLQVDIAPAPRGMKAEHGLVVRHPDFPPLCVTDIVGNRRHTPLSSPQLYAAVTHLLNATPLLISDAYDAGQFITE